MTDRTSEYDGTYQGAPGAFSEEASRCVLGPEARLLPSDTLEQAFDALTRGDARRAVVPIENTLAGSIHKTYDLLLEHDVRIVSEVVRPIAHALIAPHGLSIDGVRRVLSHPVALAQCERFFREHPHIEAIPVFDTAGAAAQVVREGQPGDAAIASRRAAEVYGGVVLADHLEDQPHNATRFLVLARPDDAGDVPHPEKLTLVFALRDEPGALAHALQPFAEHGLNVSKIESRPDRNAPFEYVFYLDVRAPSADAAIADLRRHTVWCKVLGHYAPSRGGKG